MAFLSQSFLATMVYVMEITSKGRTYKRTKVVKSKYFQKRSAGGGKLGRQTIRIVLFLTIKERKKCQLHHQMLTHNSWRTNISDVPTSFSKGTKGRTHSVTRASATSYGKLRFKFDLWPQGKYFKNKSQKKKTNNCY